MLAFVSNTARCLQDEVSKYSKFPQKHEIEGEME